MNIIDKKFIKKRIIWLGLISILLIGFILPEQLIIPVEDASNKDWNSKSFWQYPWGKSIVHMGIDIFGNKGKAILSSTYGLVLYKGNFGRGGKVLLILGSKWHLHYYAHLDSYNVSLFEIVKTGEKIASLGNTGNAINTPPHLHYSILTIFPYPWRWDKSKKGWLKMFFLNPNDALSNK